MKYFAGRVTEVRQPDDLRAFVVSRRITAGRHHNAERRARIPAGNLPAEFAVQCRQAECHEIGLQPCHDRLCLRIAHAAIEFDHFRRAVWCNHQSRVQKANVIHTVGAQSSERRMNHFVENPGFDGRVDHRRR